MSFHDIGRGMASVGREALRLYDEGRYDKDTAIQLILATLKGVNWCDGNSYEAAASLSCRCAHCLQKVNIPKDDLIFGSRFFAEESEVYRVYSATCKKRTDFQKEGVSQQKTIRSKNGKGNSDALRGSSTGERQR